MAQELAYLFGESDYADEPLWQDDDGLWIHPFKDYHKRFETREQLIEWSGNIDADARRLFSEADVIVVTLGLTEVWESVQTGRPFIHIPPPDVFRKGVARFRPTSFRDNVDSLERLHRTISSFTKAHLIVTVSPIPLYATFRDMDVRVANTISKSILRAAVAEFLLEHRDVEYFHSYEIASGLERPQELFEDDARHVKPGGVKLLIDQFMKMFADDGSLVAPDERGAVEGGSDLMVRAGVGGDTVASAPMIEL
jgi:hypothetical protein